MPYILRLSAIGAQVDLHMNNCVDNQRRAMEELLQSHVSESYQVLRSAASNNRNAMKPRFEGPFSRRYQYENICKS